MPAKSTLDQLSVIPPRSRAEQLADTLLQHIRQAGLGPGDRLGTLDEIRAEVGFARTTVSEAVRLLRERGAIEIRPGRGGGLFIAAETPARPLSDGEITRQLAAQGLVVARRTVTKYRQLLRIDPVEKRRHRF